MTDVVIVAIISLVGTLGGSFFAQRKGTALIAYRLAQLEEKVHQHNNLIDRTYKLEERMTVGEKEIKVANNRIMELEKEN